jgi:hypothetical protein
MTSVNQIYPCCTDLTRIVRWVFVVTLFITIFIKMLGHLGYIGHLQHPNAKLTVSLLDRRPITWIATSIITLLLGSRSWDDADELHEYGAFACIRFGRSGCLHALRSLAQ